MNLVFTHYDGANAGKGGLFVVCSLGLEDWLASEN